MSKKRGSPKPKERILSVLTGGAPLESAMAAAALGKEKEWERTQLGRLFQTPTVKLPETKGAPDIQAVAAAASESAMMATKEAEKKRLRLAAGRKSLIATGGRGVLEKAPVTKKRLLGE